MGRSSKIDLPVDLDLSTKSGVEALSVDLKELLARFVVQSTCNDVNFTAKNLQDIPSYWKAFIDNVSENNNLLKMIRYDIRLKSKFGSSFVGFDLYDNKLIIWFGDEKSLNNQLLRINGFIPFAAEVQRTYGIGMGAPLLTQRLIYTAETVSILFMGGVGVGSKKNRGRFPMEFVSLLTPKYIQDAHDRADGQRNNTSNHNLGVLPVFEFVNRDVKDLNSKDNFIYSDWYPAHDMILLINESLKYFAKEMRLDHTRLIGMFSQQEMQKLRDKNVDMGETRGVNMKTSVDKALDEELIIRSMAGEGMGIEKMQSNLKSVEHTQAIQSLITLFFRMCGYSWSSDNNAVYENVSQTQNENKGVYETTKEKITLFENQWGDLLTSMAFSYFKNVLKMPKSLSEVKYEFDKFVNFKIISNVILEQNNDWRKTQELFNSGLISKERAIKTIWPDLKFNEILKEITQIDKDGEKDAKKSSEVENRHFFGQEDEKNNADLEEKEENE